MRGKFCISFLILAFSCKKPDCQPINNLTDQIVEFKEQGGTNMFLGNLDRNLIFNDQQSLDSFYNVTKPWNKPQYDFNLFTILAFRTDKCISSAFQVELSIDHSLKKYLYVYQYKNCECNGEGPGRDDYYMFAVIKKLNPDYTIEMKYLF